MYKRGSLISPQHNGVSFPFVNTESVSLESGKAARLAGIAAIM